MENRRSTSPPQCRCNSRLFSTVDFEIKSAPDLTSESTTIEVTRILVCSNCGFRFDWPDRIEIKKIDNATQIEEAEPDDEMVAIRAKVGPKQVRNNPKGSRFGLLRYLRSRIKASNSDLHPKSHRKKR